MHSTSPVWDKPPAADRFRSPLPKSCDVCVLGAGIAGLSVAYELARGGKSVVVLDARSVGAGMTSCTSGHLSNVIDDRFSSLLKARGEEVARIGYQAHAAAIDAIEQTARRENIACGFARVDGYLVAAPGDEGTLGAEADACRELGVPFTEQADPQLTGFTGGRCMRFPSQARFEPVAYLAGLAAAVVRHGGVIVSNTRAAEVTDGEPCVVKTDGGAELTAGAVVVATNSPVNDRFRLHTKLFPYMTYVVGLTVPAGRSPDALIWDTPDPYHYVRPAGKPRADGTDTLTVGGEDHKTGQAHDGDDRFARLEAWARQHFPAVGEVTHRWAGQVMETIDGLGYIGRNPGDRHVFVATGDSGMGLTHGTIAGLLLPALIRGEEHPWKAAFRPGRSPAYGLSDFAQENANVALQYAGWLTPGEVSSVGEIKPGSGAVVRVGLTKVAVYRDDKGDYHGCRAVCPHLGAILAWNEAEQTWDCPAHGSRFKCTGEVMQGPANSNLTPVEIGQTAGSA